jgi:hypothetical protein
VIERGREGYSVAGMPYTGPFSEVTQRIREAMGLCLEVGNSGFSVFRIKGSVEDFRKLL